MTGFHKLTATMLLGSALAAWSSGAGASSFAVLHSFTGGADGAYPLTSLTFGPNNILYGTAVTGGQYGHGVVFKINPSVRGAFQTLYAFRAGNGTEPTGRVAIDNSGYVFGTTMYGGASDMGTIFRIAPSGAETVLHSFSGADGAYPGADNGGGLIQDARGDVYGTTYSGAAGYGTVFKISNTGSFTTLHTFQGAPSDGANSATALWADTAGNLYGDTVYGGSGTLGGWTSGFGTVFKLDASGTETILHSFCSRPNCADGALVFGDLVADSNGVLSGTTHEGGAYGYGTVFRIDGGGDEGVLYSFTGGSDGRFPVGGLVPDAFGNLYGTTNGCAQNDCGVVFRLSPTGALTVLHTFSMADGANPTGSLVSNGNVLYGTTRIGGAYGWGVVFLVTR